MPKIKIDHVVSFSSEDPIHVANNILSSDPSKKWKCKDPGEKSAIIVLQLEKASVISSIDIGNENSAYIEVLVSRSGGSDDYKVLLVMSSFMTAIEARQSTNINKVRMFTQDDMSKPECEQKWDRIKIICTQPFNRRVQYGLSFITLNSPEDKTNGQNSTANLGRFALRSDSTDDLTPGSLFAKRKEVQDEPLKGAAAIRNAASSTPPTCKPKLKTSNATPKNNNTSIDDNPKGTPRNRNEILYNKDEEEPDPKIDAIIKKNRKEKEEKAAAATPVEDTTKQKQKKVDTPSNKKTDTPKKNQKDNSGDSGESSKRKNVTKPVSPVRKKQKKDDHLRKPFAQLLSGVTIVISGIQNPDRARLRTMALAMGAKYKPDWDNSCTHLICAFANTPKFHQVRGKGKIVKRGWIEDCHGQRKRLPWRRYALDKNDVGKPESEDEIWEKLKSPTPTPPSSPQPETSKINDVEVDDDNTDAEDNYEDEMQKRIEELQKQANTAVSTAKNKTNGIDVSYTVDTDDEEVIQVKSKDITKTLADFFDKKRFHIDHLLDPDVYKLVERYIIAYKGIVMDCAGLDDVDIVIASDENLENLKQMSDTVEFVRPDWVWECHNSQQLLPIEPYKL